MADYHKIEIAVDATEAQEFAAWLQTQGHEATVGNSTGAHVDGVCTDNDIEANEKMRALWDAYCEA